MQLVFFRLYLMLHARIARFDVMGTVALFGNLGLELNTRLLESKTASSGEWSISVHEKPNV